MEKRKVYLSAGHSGDKETGAKSVWMNERKEAMELVAMIYEGFGSVENVKVRANGLALSGRVKEANAFCGKGGVAVEIHFNAGGGTGTECVVANKASAASVKVATDLSAMISKVLGIKNRGVKRVSQSGRRKLAFVDDTICPAVIVEVCFVDCHGDCEGYFSKKRELSEAIAGYLG